QPQVLAMRDTQNSSGLGGFPQSRFRCSSSSHLARGQIQDAVFISFLGGIQQRAAAWQFDVVRVRCNRQQVQFHGPSKALKDSTRAVAGVVSGVACRDTSVWEYGGRN